MRLPVIEALAEETVVSISKLLWSSARLSIILKLICSLGDDEVEMGLGIHGEPGAYKRSMASADELVKEVLLIQLVDLYLSPEALLNRSSLIVGVEARLPPWLCNRCHAGCTLQVKGLSCKTKSQVDILKLEQNPCR